MKMEEEAGRRGMKMKKVEYLPIQQKITSKEEVLALALGLLRTQKCFSGPPHSLNATLCYYQKLLH